MSWHVIGPITSEDDRPDPQPPPAPAVLVGYHVRVGGQEHLVAPADVTLVFADPDPQASP